MMIQAFHLTKIHPSGVKVLDDAFFSAPEGSFTILEGEGRAGKSTFLKMLGGEEKPTSGVLRVNQLDLYDLSEDEKRKWLSEVGMILPDLKLFPEKTVGENMLFILKVKGVHAKGQEESIRKLLENAGLGSKLGAKPSDLSSGEQRMVLALRAMIFRPRLLLADDPFQGLSGNAASVLLKFFLELNKTGTTVVLSAQKTDPLEEARPGGGKAPFQWLSLREGKFYPLQEQTP